MKDPFIPIRRAVKCIMEVPRTIRPACMTLFHQALREAEAIETEQLEQQNLEIMQQAKQNALDEAAATRVRGMTDNGASPPPARDESAVLDSGQIYPAGAIMLDMRK